MQGTQCGWKQTDRTRSSHTISRECDTTPHTITTAAEKVLQ